MGIMLGNLTVKQIEDRLEIKLTDTDRQALEATRQDKASDIAADKWHCFDMPFVLVVGSYDMAIKVRDILSPYSGEMKGQLQIAMDK